MRPKDASRAPIVDLPDARAIDERYGLKPACEPGTGSGGLTPFVTVQCPYCGEQYETAVDLSAGSFRYVEAAQVCCQPIEPAGEVDEDGGLLGVTAGRG